MTNRNNQIWNKHRDQLQAALKKAVLDLFEHTSANCFRFPLNAHGGPYIEVKAVSDEPTASVSIEEHERYKRCLYRANGRLIQLGQEPEKLEYSQKSESDYPAITITRTPGTGDPL